MFTPREEMIRALILTGMSNTAIAGLLGIHENTVKVHLAHIRHKLGAIDEGGRFWVKYAYEEGRKDTLAEILDLAQEGKLDAYLNRANSPVEASS